MDKIIRIADNPDKSVSSEAVNQLGFICIELKYASALEFLIRHNPTKRIMVELIRIASSNEESHPYIRKYAIAIRNPLLRLGVLCLLEKCTTPETLEGDVTTIVEYAEGILDAPLTDEYNIEYQKIIFAMNNFYPKLVIIPDIRLRVDACMEKFWDNG